MKLLYLQIRSVINKLLINVDQIADARACDKQVDVITKVINS